jgi:hypothetical protein
MHSALARPLGSPLALALLVLTAALPATAADEPLSRGACRADVERLCKGVQPGGGAYGQCLRQHQSELSPECREHMASRHEHMMQQAQAVRAACSDEVAKHCSDVDPGEGGLVACLREHESSLGDACKKALPPQHGRRGGPRP